MGKLSGIIAVCAIWGVILASVTGWFLNLAHCLSYIGGGHPDDTTAEVVMRVIGIFTFLPGAIAGWL